ncbi:hypothetical protein ACFO1B_17035 [Dactylosporangium siamense]|nr:hypothetical protein [Dactylosporangium siamense]
MLYLIEGRVTALVDGTPCDVEPKALGESADSWRSPPAMAQG